MDKKADAVNLMTGIFVPLYQKSHDSPIFKKTNPNPQLDMFISALLK